MPDLSRLLQDAITALSRPARHLPGRVGGYGTYFATQRDLVKRPWEVQWRDVVDELLRLSDRELSGGHIDAALSWFDKALRTSYHPALHNRGESPLAESPDAFLAPLRDSRTGATLFGEAAVSASDPERPAPRRGDRETTRVLVIAQQNWTFIRPVLDALRDCGRYEIQEIEVDELPADEIPQRDQLLRSRYDLMTSGRRIKTPSRIAAGYDWADAVLVEWGHHVLTWATLLDRAPRRLIARYHRFEAFTPFPLLHDLARIDATLYVSPAIANLLDAIRPVADPAPRHYVANLLRRGLGDAPEGPRDRHRLVQVGWSNEVKDVTFSLDLLERLRRHDDRFRLQLVGAGLPGSRSDRTPYQQEVRERLERLGSEAVELLGVREDVPEILSAAGFVLSSSLQEGTHESVMEGLAAGCPAVVRNWPDLVEYGGARTIYDRSWVVDDVDAGVERVLELSDPERYQTASRQAREWAVSRRGIENVLTGYDEVFRGLGRGTGTVGPGHDQDEGSGR